MESGKYDWGMLTETLSTFLRDLFPRDKCQEDADTGNNASQDVNVIQLPDDVPVEKNKSTDEEIHEIKEQLSNIMLILQSMR